MTACNYNGQNRKYHFYCDIMWQNMLYYLPIIQCQSLVGVSGSN